MTKDGLIYTIQLKKKKEIQKAQKLDDVPVWVSYVALKRLCNALKINCATCRQITGKNHLKKNSIFKQSQSAAKQ